MNALGRQNRPMSLNPTADMTRWLVTAALVAVACSGSPIMTHEQLESEMRHLRSLDAEAQLLQDVVAAHHSKSRFTREHARYLQRSAHEHAHSLAQARSAPGDEAELERVRAAATRLEERFVALVIEMQ